MSSSTSAKPNIRIREALVAAESQGYDTLHDLLGFLGEAYPKGTSNDTLLAGLAMFDAFAKRGELEAIPWINFDYGEDPEFGLGSTRSGDPKGRNMRAIALDCRNQRAVDDLHQPFYDSYTTRTKDWVTLTKVFDAFDEIGTCVRVLDTITDETIRRTVEVVRELRSNDFAPGIAIIYPDIGRDRPGRGYLIERKNDERLDLASHPKFRGLDVHKGVAWLESYPGDPVSPIVAYFGQRFNENVGPACGHHGTILWSACTNAESIKRALLIVLGVGKELGQWRERLIKGVRPRVKRIDLIIDVKRSDIGDLQHERCISNLEGSEEFELLPTVDKLTDNGLDAAIKVVANAIISKRGQLRFSRSGGIEPIVVELSDAGLEPQVLSTLATLAFCRPTGTGEQSVASKFDQEIGSTWPDDTRKRKEDRLRKRIQRVRDYLNALAENKGVVEKDVKALRKDAPVDLRVVVRSVKRKG